jgi:hypothetical protein
MNVQELARADFSSIAENNEAAGSPYSLIDHEGNVYEAAGIIGDISLLFDPATGTPVRSRSITATCGVLSLAAKTDKKPERGWKAVITDLYDRKIELFVQGNDPDYTLGIYNLILGITAEES